MYRRKTSASPINPSILEEILQRCPLPYEEAEKGDFIGVCDKIQLAHWEYLDNYRSREEFFHQRFRDFIYTVFNQDEVLNKELPRLEGILDSWRKYDISRPRCRAIIFSENLSDILLVRSFKTGWWCFPGGKLERDESFEECIIREILEEAGYDISSRVFENDWVVSEHNPNTRMYIIKNVPLTVRMKPTVKNEITACRWFSVQNLLTRRGNARSGLDIHSEKFSYVRPYLEIIRRIHSNF